MSRILFGAALAIASVLVTAPEIRAQTTDDQGDSLVTVTLKSGESYVGVITAQDDASITVRTASGVDIRIPRNQIAQMTWVRPTTKQAPRWRRDPNYSRLLFAPTGRPLAKGDGYFSDVYVFLAGVGTGLTDNVGGLVGMSLIPGVGFDQQVFYVAPKVGHQFHEDFAASVGTVFFTASGTSGGIVWGVSTFGKVEASFTAGLGFGYVKEENDPDYQLSKKPIILIGGSVQVSNSASLVTENWIITGQSPSEMPFSLAVRLFGDRLSADFGFLFIGEVLREGVPIPWLSMCYNFGKSGID